NGWQTLAPSAIPYYDNNPHPPKEMTKQDIQKVVQDFKDAARRAHKACYKVLEIHAAHGYLIHQFLSPLCNNRTDEYGGSFENRIRLLLEILEAVKTEWPNDLPLFVRISGTDWAPGGWDIDESV